MGPASGEDAAELRKRAERLRECAREARALARRLGPYLDDAVKKATPRASGFPTGADKGALWQGPFADERVDSYEVTPSGNGVELAEQLQKMAATEQDHQLATSLYRRYVGMVRTALGVPQG